MVRYRPDRYGVCVICHSRDGIPLGFCEDCETIRKTRPELEKFDPVCQVCRSHILEARKSWQQ